MFSPIPSCLALSVSCISLSFLQIRFQASTAFGMPLTFIRVPAGTLLAAGAFVDAGEPLMVAVALLGGGAVALGSHATKAGSWVIVNSSPEPVSNWIALLLEDIIVIVGISLAVAKPVFFFAMLGVFCLFAVWLLPKIWRGLKSIFARFFPAKADGSPKVEGPENRGFDLYHTKNRYLKKVLRAMRRNPFIYGYIFSFRDR